MGKHNKKIQSRPTQRRALEIAQWRLLQGSKLTRKETQGFGGDEFSAEALSSMLSPDPAYSKKALTSAIQWLNAGLEDGDGREYYVRNRWHEFDGYVRAWRENLRREMRRSNGREAEILLTLASAWAAGDLTAIRRCVQCTDFFLAERSNQQFCKSECRSAFYHEIETKHPEYKKRKASEAVRRRKRAKDRKLRQYVHSIISTYPSMPGTQLNADLAAAAKKFKVTLATVTQIVRSLSPNKGGKLLTENHRRSVAIGKH